MRVGERLARLEKQVGPGDGAGRLDWVERHARFWLEDARRHFGWAVAVVLPLVEAGTPLQEWSPGELDAFWHVKVFLLEPLALSVAPPEARAAYAGRRDPALDARWREWVRRCGISLLGFDPEEAPEPDRYRHRPDRRGSGP